MMLSDYDVDRIARRVVELLNKKGTDYPFTMQEKAKQLGLSLSRFRQIYMQMNDIEYQKLPGRRRIMFK